MIGRARRADFQAALIMAAFVTRTSNRPNGNRYDQPGDVLDGGDADPYPVHVIEHGLVELDESELDQVLTAYRIGARLVRLDAEEVERALPGNRVGAK
jgi:hypothetical protein